MAAIPASITQAHKSASAADLTPLTSETGTYLTVLTSGSTTMTLFTNETARPAKVSGAKALLDTRVSVGGVLGILSFVAMVLVL